MIPKTRDEALSAMKACASAQGDRFDLTAFAIAAAIHENPDRDLGVALATLERVTHLAQSQRPYDGQGFATLMFGELGFTGGRGDYDAPANADIISILQSRTGLPIGLGHVWRHGARAIELPLHGTDSPGHFIMRLETSNQPVFLDPFEGGAIVDEDGLDAIAQRAQLQKLTPRMLSPVSDRVMAVRLQTNVLARAKARGDVETWFRAAQRRLILAPQNYQIVHEFAGAAEAAGHIKTALEWAQRATQLPGAPSGSTSHQQTQHIQSLSRKLN